MLFFQNPGTQRFSDIVVGDGNHRLQNDRASIERLIDKVHGAAAEFHAVIERLALRLESGKRRQQRGMDIENSAAKRRDEVRREQAHESGQAHQIHARLVQRGDNQAIIGFPLHSFRRNHARRNAALGGAQKARGVLAIADHDGDFSIGNAARRYAIGQCLKIGTAAAKQNANSFGHEPVTLAQSV